MCANLNNPVKDGCGPYGRHLTGAVSWQKLYGCTFSSYDSLLLVANKDYLIPTPPPSEEITTAAFLLELYATGASSFIRAAIYDFETFPEGKLIVDAGEFAMESVSQKTWSMSPIKIPRNARCGIMICARGSPPPTLITGEQDRAGPSWLGNNPTRIWAPIGMIRFSRTNAAFPATYNGTYDSIEMKRFAAVFQL